MLPAARVLKQYDASTGPTAASAAGVVEQADSPFTTINKVSQLLIQSATVAVNSKADTIEQASAPEVNKAQQEAVQSSDGEFSADEEEPISAGNRSEAGESNTQADEDLVASGGSPSRAMSFSSSSSSASSGSVRVETAEEKKARLNLRWLKVKSEAFLQEGLRIINKHRALIANTRPKFCPCPVE